MGGWGRLSARGGLISGGGGVGKYLGKLGMGGMGGFAASMVGGSIQEYGGTMGDETLLGMSGKTVSSVGGGLSGAGSGAMMGAMVGSVIPVVGTIAGGVIGGVIGAFSGFTGAADEATEAMKKRAAAEKAEAERIKQEARQANIQAGSEFSGKYTSVFASLFKNKKSATRQDLYNLSGISDPRGNNKLLQKYMTQVKKKWLPSMPWGGWNDEAYGAPPISGHRKWIGQFGQYGNPKSSITFGGEPGLPDRTSHAWSHFPQKRRARQMRGQGASYQAVANLMETMGVGDLLLKYEDETLNARNIGGERGIDKNFINPTFDGPGGIMIKSPSTNWGPIGDQFAGAKIPENSNGIWEKIVNKGGEQTGIKFNPQKLYQEIELRALKELESGSFKENKALFPPETLDQAGYHIQPEMIARNRQNLLSALLEGEDKTVFELGGNNDGPKTGKDILKALRAQDPEKQAGQIAIGKLYRDVAKAIQGEHKAILQAKEGVIKTLNFQKAQAIIQNQITKSLQDISDGYARQKMNIKAFTKSAGRGVGASGAASFVTGMSGAQNSLSSGLVNAESGRAKAIWKTLNSEPYRSELVSGRFFEDGYKGLDLSKGFTELAGKGKKEAALAVATQEDREKILQYIRQSTNDHHALNQMLDTQNVIYEGQVYNLERIFGITKERLEAERELSRLQHKREVSRSKYANQNALWSQRASAGGQRLNLQADLRAIQRQITMSSGASGPMDSILSQQAGLRDNFQSSRFSSRSGTVNRLMGLGSKYEGANVAGLSGIRDLGNNYLKGDNRALKKMVDMISGVSQDDLFKESMGSQQRALDDERKRADFFSAQLTDDDFLESQEAYDDWQISLDKIQTLEESIAMAKETQKLATDSIKQEAQQILADTTKIESLEDKILAHKIKQAEAEWKKKTGPGSGRAGREQAYADMKTSIATFEYDLNTTIVNGFRDGMVSAMEAAIYKADDLGSALRGIAVGFLQAINKALMTATANNIVSSLGFNSGGKVNARVSNGEFLMNKGAVRKYGTSFMNTLNSGSLPGYAKGGQFSPREQTLRGEMFTGRYTRMPVSSRFLASNQNIQLTEDRQFAKGEYQRAIQEAHKKRVEKAQMKRALLSMALNAAFSAGMGALTSGGGGQGLGHENVTLGKDTYKVTGSGDYTFGGKTFTQSQMTTKIADAEMLGTGIAPTFSKPGMFQKIGMSWHRSPMRNALFAPQEVYGTGGDYSELKKSGRNYKWSYNEQQAQGHAEGGLISGRGGVDQIPAMLTEGEYVIRGDAVRKLGLPALNAINAGKFAQGGPTSNIKDSGSPSKGGDNTNNVNITVNVENTGKEGDSKSEGDGGQVEMMQQLGKMIKEKVIVTIQEEQRPGGLLSR